MRPERVLIATSNSGVHSCPLASLRPAAASYQPAISLRHVGSVEDSIILESCLLRRCSESDTMLNGTTMFTKPTLPMATVIVAIFVASSTRAGKHNEPAQPVTTVRVPKGGIQPQIAIDGKGVLHMVYF